MSIHIFFPESIDCNNKLNEEFSLKEYIEERAVEIGMYIIDSNATVRQTAKKFGVSKSTVHTVVTKLSGFYGI